MDTGEQLAVNVIEDNRTEMIAKLHMTTIDLYTRLRDLQRAVHREHHSPVTSYTDCPMLSCRNTIHLLQRVREAHPAAFPTDPHPEARSGEPSRQPSRPSEGAEGER